MKIEAVLFDRDETLIEDVPYNGDPAQVRPLPGVRTALDRLRAAKIPIGVVSNQSGVGRGLISMEQVAAVNRRVDELLGPFDGWFVCPHRPEDDCDCRKPKPKLILDAARAFGAAVDRCVMIGDKQSDVDAALNAGAIAMQVSGERDLASVVSEILES